MSNILFTRDFNSDTLGQVPANATPYGFTPDTTPWHVVASGPNATYFQSLRVLQSTWIGGEEQGDLSLLKFSAIEPIDTENSESITLFKGAVQDSYLAFHSILQLQYGGNPLFSFYEIFARMDLRLEYPELRAIENWDSINGKGIGYEGKYYQDFIATDPDTWYLMRFQVRVIEDMGTYMKGKIWPFGTEEPSSWMYQAPTSQVFANSEPGVSFGLEGAGLVDIAYFSVGYGVDNPPAMPTSGGGSQTLNRTCTSGFTFNASGTGETPPPPPVELQRAASSKVSFKASTRIWRPYSLAHLSFNALAKVFTFNATVKRFVYSAKPGRTE